MYVNEHKTEILSIEIKWGTLKEHSIDESKVDFGLNKISNNRIEIWNMDPVAFSKTKAIYKAW